MFQDDESSSDDAPFDEGPEIAADEVPFDGVLSEDRTAACVELLHRAEGFFPSRKRVFGGRDAALYVETLWNRILELQAQQAP